MFICSYFNGADELIGVGETLAQSFEELVAEYGGVLPLDFSPEWCEFFEQVHVVAKSAVVWDIQKER